MFFIVFIDIPQKYVGLFTILLNFMWTDLCPEWTFMDCFPTTCCLSVTLHCGGHASSFLITVEDSSIWTDLWLPHCCWYYIACSHLFLYPWVLASGKIIRSLRARLWRLDFLYKMVQAVKNEHCPFSRQHLALLDFCHPICGVWGGTVFCFPLGFTGIWLAYIKKQIQSGHTLATGHREIKLVLTLLAIFHSTRRCRSGCWGWGHLTQLGTLWATIMTWMASHARECNSGMNVIGITNCFTTGFKVCSPRRHICLQL